MRAHTMTAAAAATLAGATAAWSAPGLAPHVPLVCRSLGIARRLNRAGPSVALTFDDGPHPEGTPAVLDALEAGGARGTFFLVGEQVERRPALAAEIVTRGHGVALHGYRHRNAMLLGPRALADDLSRAIDAIAAGTGRLPTLFRPPYGIFTPASLAIVRQRRWAPLLWSRWGRDWRRRASADGIAATATRDLVAGDVVLLHDADFYSAEASWKRTAAAIPRVLEEIARHGLSPVLV